MMPWWACIGLALLSYFILHDIASAPFQPPNVKDLSPGFMQLGVKAYAMAGQVIVPVACIMGAVISFWRRKKRSSKFLSVVNSDSDTSLGNMTWKEFEATVSEAFRLDGFTVEERGGAAPDGGIDLVLHRGNETFLVQCKQWKARSVGVDVVRELYGVMAAERATGGFVVTSGSFTRDARLFAEGREIILVDGPILFDMIKNARRAPTINVRRLDPVTPDCPTCGSPMVSRIAKRGENAGKSFWGCSRYPACKGTRTL